MKQSGISQRCITVAILLMSAPWAIAQPDFELVDLHVCRVPGGEMEITYEIGYTPDFEINPDSIDVDATISITGPSTPAPLDVQTHTLQKPLDVGACVGNPPCNGACNPWTAIFYKNGNAIHVAIIQASCATTSATPPCQCAVPDKIELTKKKPEHDGADETYTITVTVDADNAHAESNEANNSMTVILPAAGGMCQGGACCLSGVACVDGVFAFECADQFGSYQGDGSTCGGVSCPTTGACCLSAGCTIATATDCFAVGGIYRGDGAPCLGDGNTNGVDDACEDAIPTVSEWGLIIMTLLLLTAGTLVFRRQRPAQVSADAR